MIIYLHGFRSGPQSWKSRSLKARMDQLGLGDAFWGGQLPVSAHEAMALAEAQIARCSTPPTLVGSSLGGYYATCLAERHGLKILATRALLGIYGHYSFDASISMSSRPAEAETASRLLIQLAIQHGEPGWEAEAQYDLGAWLLSQDRNTEAMNAFTAAIRLRPEYAKAHNNLGIAIASTGDLTRAMAQFEEALRLQPGFADAAKNLEIARRARRTP